MPKRMSEKTYPDLPDRTRCGNVTAPPLHVALGHITTNALSSRPCRHLADKLPTASVLGAQPKPANQSSSADA